MSSSETPSVSKRCLRYWRVLWVEHFDDIPKGWEPFVHITHGKILVRRKVWFWQ